MAALRGGQLIGPLELQRHGVVIAGLRGETLRRVVGDDLAARDDDGARADRIHLFEDVGGDDDDLVARHLVDERAHFVLLVGIETVRGLIEDQHRRVVDQRLREADAAPEAFGERVDGLREHLLELQPPDDVGQPLRALLALQLAQLRDEFEERPSTVISP